MKRVSHALLSLSIALLLAACNQANGTHHAPEQKLNFTVSAAQGQKAKEVSLTIIADNSIDYDRILVSAVKKPNLDSATIDNQPIIEIEKSEISEWQKKTVTMETAGTEYLFTFKIEKGDKGPKTAIIIAELTATATSGA